MNVTVEIAGERLVTWDGFHRTFAEVFGFPDYYGHNMNAWIDCMTSLDDPNPQSNVSVEEGEFLVMSVTSANYVKDNAPDIWHALNECTAFVNYRRIKKGDGPVIALSYYV